MSKNKTTKKETVDVLDEEQGNSPVSELTNQLEELQAKVQENWDKFLAASAEVDNVRKRAERDIANAHKYGVEKFAKSLLPVLDSMEKSLETFNESEHDVSAIQEGAELTFKMLLDALEKVGVEQLDPQGEPFDPQLHEAMSTQPAEGLEPNTVVTVLQKGYKLEGRLLRPAMVIVSS